MLIEIWERLRGYDKWLEAQAKIESSNVNRTAHSDRSGNVSYTWSSGDQLVWTDSRGEKHRADFTVHDDSPLYQLVGGESVSIRYNPADPDNYYFRELLRTRINRFFKVTLYTVAFITFVLLFGWLRVQFGASGR